MLENKICKCPTCGNTLKKKDNRKTAVLLIISGVLLIPTLLVIAYGTTIPFVLLLIHFATGLYYLLMKERFFYFCKSCYIKYSENELKMKVNGGSDIIT